MRSLIAGPAALVLAAAVCAGCATAGPPTPGTITYVKPGATRAQAERDKIECAKVTTGSNQQRVGPVLGFDRDSVNGCMRDLGYEVRLTD